MIRRKLRLLPPRLPVRRPRIPADAGEAYEAGWRLGYDEGRSDGWDAGYDQGRSDARVRHYLLR